MDKFTFQGDMEASNRILYTPSVFAKQNLIHLQEIGSLQATSPHTNRRKNLDSYLFFLVESGSGILEYQQATWQLSAGDCIFIDCQFPYAHSTSEHLWQLRWVHFNGSNMGSIYQKYVERGGTPVFRPKDPLRYETVLSSLLEIASSSSHVKDMSICEKLTALLTFLMEDSWHADSRENGASKRRNLALIKDYLDSHYAEPIDLDTLSGLFFINKFYLTRIFKEQYGITINSYLQQVRITHAKQLLRFSDQSIDKIGAECGLNDANYFSRVFKKVEGMPPGEFRKRW